MTRDSILDRLRTADRIAGIRGIARRYLAMNAFDGVVTTMGLLAGGWVAGIEDPRTMLLTGLATALAMATSGFWGAYLTETAERRQQLDEIERQTLTDQSDTQVGRASRVAVIVVTLVDGLSPLCASLFVLLPFIFSSAFAAADTRYAASLALALSLLAGLGLFLGRVSRGNALAYAAKTLVAGIMAVGLGLSLRFLD